MSAASASNVPRVAKPTGTGEIQSVFLGVGDVSAPVEVCAELLMDTKMKPQFDSLFDKAFIIEEITNFIKIEKHEYWSPPLIAKRDFCMQLHRARLEDGRIVLSGKSVTHARCPEDPKFLRGHVHVDLKGNLPAILKEKLAEKQPEQVHIVKPLLAKRVKEMGNMSEEQKEAPKKLMESLPMYTMQQIKEALNE